MIRVCDSTEQVGNRVLDPESNCSEGNSFPGRTGPFLMFFPRWFILAWPYPCGRRASGCKMPMDAVRVLLCLYPLSLNRGSERCCCRLQARSPVSVEQHQRNLHSFLPKGPFFKNTSHRPVLPSRRSVIHPFPGFPISSQFYLSCSKALLLLWPAIKPFPAMTDHFENVNKGTRLGSECLYENKQTENLICFIRFCRRWHRCSHWGLASSGHQH